MTLAFGLVPQLFIDSLRGLANLWNLGLLIAVGVSLLWFVYRVLLRKLIRARRIANIRLSRLMREQASGRSDLQ